jgi:hypothetical protein
VKFTLSRIAKLVELAVGHDPPQAVLDICGEDYSPYYYLFYLLTWTNCGGIAVELGVEKGRGSACLAAGSRHSRVFGFDTRCHDEVRKLRRQYPNFTFVHQPSLAPDPDKFEFSRWKRINILHIDTGHAQAEFGGYRPFLRDGAVVCFNDLHAQNDGVLAYFSSLPYPKLQDDRLHPVHGYGVLIYQTEDADGSA